MDLSVQYTEAPNKGRGSPRVTSQRRGRWRLKAGEETFQALGLKGPLWVVEMDLIPIEQMCKSSLSAEVRAREQCGPHQEGVGRRLPSPLLVEPNSQVSGAWVQILVVPASSLWPRTRAWTVPSFSFLLCKMGKLRADCNHINC